MLMKYHTGVSAEWIRLYAHFGGQVLGTPGLIALKLFPETAFSSDHNNNLKWAIIKNIMYQSSSPKIFFK